MGDRGLARIGAFATPFDAARLSARILINRAYSDPENPYDADRLWRGLGGGLVSGLGGALGGAFGRASAPAAHDPDGPDPVAPRAVAADAVEDEQFPGLRALIEAHPYTRLEPVESETMTAAARALPFEHFALSARGAGRQLRGVENALRRFYEQLFGALAARPPRFEFFDDPLAPDSVRVRIQFGFGVHLPEDGDRPEGGVDVAAPDRRDPSAPGEFLPLRLGDPEAGRQAGLYRGQSGLAFASALRFAPAIAAPGVLPENHVFFYGRISEEDPPAFRILPVGPAALEGGRNFTAEAVVDESDEDAGRGFTVRGPTGRPEFFCRIRRDQRVGALSLTPPRERAHLKLIGLVLPETGAFHELREWWIDFTQSGRLSVAPLDERAWAVGSGPLGRFGGGSGGVARLYNRAQREEAGLFDLGEELRLGPRQTLFRRRVALADPADGSAARRWRVRLHARRALGWATLAPASRQLVTPRLSDADDALSLHWLDACGGVAPAAVGAGPSDEIGLASWSLGGAGLRLTRGEGGALIFAADRDLTLAAIDADDRLTPVAAGAELRVVPNDELLIGPHHFRYVGVGGDRSSDAA